MSEWFDNLHTCNDGIVWCKCRFLKLCICVVKRVCTGWAKKVLVSLLIFAITLSTTGQFS